MYQPRTPALRLLLACARAHPSGTDEKTIGDLLNEDFDWTQFAQKALDHSLAGLAGRTLNQVASDRIPSDIADAFRAIIEQTRNRNQVLLNELFQLVEQLANAGVETISFKGPVLAMTAFGDLGLRSFQDLDILIHDHDLTKAMACLHILGFQRYGKLTPTQFDAIHHLQGQEIIFNVRDVAVEPHTRLTPLKMALSIDYDGLWRRAQRLDVDGKTMLTFSPEDTLLVLAIHGGKELWWDIKWACDVADFIASHPELNWDAILERARKQGCSRMLLVATSLARNYLGARIPAHVIGAEAADKTVDRIINRIIARWDLDDAGGPPSNKTLSLDRLLLHDGLYRRASYVMRTWFLPGPEHVPIVSLPPAFGFAYIPIALAHDLVALPLYRAYEMVRGHMIGLAGALSRLPLAVLLSPKLTEARRRRNSLQKLLAKTERATAANPKDGTAWGAMAETLASLGRLEQAISSYDKVLLIAPDNGQLWKKRDAVIADLRKQTKSSQPSGEPSFDPKTAEGWALRAGFLASSKEHFSDAAEASDCALRLDPNNLAALRIGMEARQKTCDWSQRENDKRRAGERLKAGVSILRSITFKQVFDSAEDSLTLARHWTKNFPPARVPLWQGEKYHHDKIRIAYLSTDLRSHAVGHTVLGLLEHHDKDRFEITAVSIGINDNSRARERIQAAVDHFVDAATLDDAAAAGLMRAREIDIAVDLNGLTGHKRTGILARRPAPVQVSFIGYPGTMAVPFMDYLIADPIVIPEEHRGFYTEKIAYLPDSYLPFDAARTSGEKPNRRDQGLPENGFVFCCFNAVQKINPEIFDVWMRLLHAVDGSVLWLAGSNVAVIANLRKEAVARGISPERIIFARFEKKVEDHLARQSLGDIFLDTTPYNAHSTGNDALWAGLPILTSLGNDFQSRVAASLLSAAGLPELVTANLAEYENLALALARDPQRLALLRDKLARNRQTAPLFDIGRYTRNLEAVYQTMWRRQQSGLPPESFAVGTNP